MDHRTEGTSESLFYDDASSIGYKANIRADHCHGYTGQKGNKWNPNAEIPATNRSNDLNA